MSNPNKNITLIGGGTGTFVVISGLKQHQVDLSAIITVADSGGSTGRLRDEFGFLPVGDMRQALAALADDKKQTLIRDLLLYRFAKGSGLEGHNLGNLILTALQDISGSTAKALNIAGHIFRLHGKIYPITTQNIQLVIEYLDGTTIIGEHLLDDYKLGGKKISSVKTSPRAKIYSKASEAITNSDLIIFGPGDLYASIIPNLVVSGFKKAIKSSKAKLVYVVNLMTRYTQTHNMTATDHVHQIEKYLPRQLDVIIINTQGIPKSLIHQYQNQKEFPVTDDLDSDKRRVIRDKLISVKPVAKHPKDQTPRSYLRHDSTKLAKIVFKLI